MGAHATRSCSAGRLRRRHESGSSVRPRSTMRPFHSAVGGQLEVGEPADQGTQRDLGLHPGQRGAEAVVDAAAERQQPRRRWAAGGRASSASAPNVPGSRLAEPRHVITNVPGSMVASPIGERLRDDAPRELHRDCRSAAARRRRWRRATDRRCQASSWSRWRSRASMPLPMRLTVVSCPATNSSPTLSISSCVVSVSPSSSAVISADSRSSAEMAALPLDDLADVAEHVLAGDHRVTSVVRAHDRVEHLDHLPATSRAADRGRRRACRASRRSR